MLAGSTWTFQSASFLLPLCTLLSSLCWSSAFSFLKGGDGGITWRMGTLYSICKERSIRCHSSVFIRLLNWYRIHLHYFQVVCLSLMTFLSLNMILALDMTWKLLWRDLQCGSTSRSIVWNENAYSPRVLDQDDSSWIWLENAWRCNCQDFKFNNLPHHCTGSILMMVTDLNKNLSP